MPFRSPDLRRFVTPAAHIHAIFVPLVQSGKTVAQLVFGLARLHRSGDGSGPFRAGGTAIRRQASGQGRGRLPGFQHRTDGQVTDRGVGGRVDHIGDDIGDPVR